MKTSCGHATTSRGGAVDDLHMHHFCQDTFQERYLSVGDANYSAMNWLADGGWTAYGNVPVY